MYSSNPYGTTSDFRFDGRTIAWGNYFLNAYYEVKLVRPSGTFTIYNGTNNSVVIPDYIYAGSYEVNLLTYDRSNGMQVL